jgi:hypothetical protein
MLRLYLGSEPGKAAEITRALRESTLAHRVLPGRCPGKSAESAKSGAPALEDDEGVYMGAAAILKRLEELELECKEWYKYQSDACYCDDEGNIV